MLVEMFKSAYIIPTGDEIKEGLVIDTDSPMVMQEILKLSPCCQIYRMPPVPDNQDEIVSKIRTFSESGADLIVLIGGSGGGHRHSPTLAQDFTHSGLDELMPDAHSTALYGKNGHMWCKMICGLIGGTLVINLPGPFQEAQAAMVAFNQAIKKHGLSPEHINERMAQVVKEQFGVK